MKNNLCNYDALLNLRFKVYFHFFNQNLRLILRVFINLNFDNKNEYTIKTKN